MIKKSRNIIALMLVTVMLIGVFIPTFEAANNIMPNGFDKGPSYTSVVPTKEVTFVNFDEESYIDDYSYLAAIPTSVFYDKNKDQIFSNPLLFYQDEYPIEKEKERSLNARQGIDYFLFRWEVLYNHKRTTIGQNALF